MKFYSIQHSLNKKIIGNYPQTKDIHYNCHVWDDPKFVEHVHFEEVNFEPITANAILYPKSKQTDLINANSAMGFSNKLLVSGKLKNILEKSRENGMQFFKAPIIQNNVMIEDYWLLNMYEVNNEFVDFNKTSIFYRKHNPNTIEDSKLLFFKSLEEFNTKVDQRHYLDEIRMNNVYIKESVTSNFFQLRYGVKYMVSEKLKQEIEDAGCTGIEFQLSELSINEWLHGGEREKVYGKA